MASIYGDATADKIDAEFDGDLTPGSEEASARRSTSVPASSRFRLAILALIGLCPSFLKLPLYRLLFGYRIGRGVRIGYSIIDARTCVIEDHVRIGHLNIFTRIATLTIKDHARIGHMNIFRGGEIYLGRYSEIIRLNEVNSIPDPDVVNAVEPRFLLGDGSIVTTGHKIDFTDRVTIGRRTILGGRNSSLWTHNRQRTQPIEIGDFAYIGSEIRIAPGGAIPARCVVGIGAVITSKLKDEQFLIAGIPAKAIKPLSQEDQFLIKRKTRPDLPDDI
ncbi:MAG: hypothetical protein ABJC05_02730 [Pyrinomonadaceae bacterium]